MGQTLARRLTDPPRRMLAMRGEVDSQKLGEPDLRRAFGRVIARAIDIAGLTVKELTALLDYTDTSVVGKWIAGTENPQTAKLMAIPKFRTAFLIAIAELGGHGVEVRTIVTVERAS